MRWPPAFRSPTCRRATRSSSRSRWRGPRCSRRATSSSASTHSTTAGIRTAGRSTSRRSSAWRTWRRRPASRAPSGSKIHAPLMQLTKEGIIRRGLELGVDYSVTQSCYDPDAEGRACGALRRLPAAPAGLRRGGRARPRAVRRRRGRSAMSYAVKEIFYTLQGEGANAGRPAVFCRFAGCNLWSGRERDRGKRGVHVLRHRLRRAPTAPDGGKFATAAELARRGRRALAARQRAQHGRSSSAPAASRCCRWTPRSSTRSTRRGFEIAVETNGTLEPPAGIDWVCVSPKAGSTTVLLRGDELKLVYPQAEATARALRRRRLRALLPAAHGRPRRSRPTSQRAIAYCLAHPQWRLSLQTHKITGIR